ncbi:MAG: hypothetical protein GY804_09485 [Alphaproteobacteria bacterium]|nr:hypothetical protein [Alphaproteobacteria bacterium]
MSTIQDASKISSSVNTAAGLKDSLIFQLGRPYLPDPRITLNTLHNAHAGIAGIGYPDINCFIIGIEGEYNVDSTNRSECYYPDGGELGLYKQIPFRVVPVDEDLTENERQLYRLRERKIIDTEEYFLYWAKVMELSDYVELTKTLSDNSTMPYDLDPSQLTPQPTKLPSGGGAINTETINAGTEGILTVTGPEVLEAIKIIYDGDLRIAKISEFGICSGIDTTVTGSGATGEVTYTESLDTKLINKTCCVGIPVNQPSSIEKRKIIIGSNRTIINS